jgi:hypothetical protein
MTIISLDAIQPGMVVSDDVVHANGRVLLRADSELTEQHIKIFKTWGILKVGIKSADSDSEQLAKRHAADAINAVEHKQRVLFQHCDLAHPFVAELFRLSVQKELEQGAGSH